MNINIIYIANSSIPSTSANSVHVMKMCEAFRENGAYVELWVPNIGDNSLLEENNLEDVFEFYGIKNRFPIKYERLINKTPIGIYNYLFSFIAVIKSLKYKNAVIYTRNPIVSFFCIVFRKKHILELHGKLEAVSRRLSHIFKFFKLFNSKYMVRLVVISNNLKNIYLNSYSVNNLKIVVLPDGVNPKNFKCNSEPLMKFPINVGYVGSFNPGKGIEIIKEIIKKLKEKNIREYYFHIYGGDKKQVGKFKRDVKDIGFKEIKIYGHVPNNQIPTILCKQDILLMPYKKHVKGRGLEDISQWMSPMKMFEYMASGRVIISSDLPVIREVLNESNAYLVQPDDVNRWIETMEHIKNSREEAINKAKKAKGDVLQYSWQERARKIVELINE